MTTTAVINPNGQTVCLDQELEDEDQEARILPLEEFLEKIKYRSDIFLMDRDTLLSKIEIACLGCAAIACVTLATIEITKDEPEYISPSGPSIERTIRVQITEKPQPVQPPQVRHIPDRATLHKRIVKTGTNGNNGSGVGIASSRVARDKAFRAHVGNMLKGRSIAGAEAGALQGFAEGIDAILAGVNTLKQGGHSVTGRMGEAGIGFMAGVGKSGFNGPGTNDLGDPFASLMPPDVGTINLRHKEPKLDLIHSPLNIGHNEIKTNGRTRSSIMSTFLQNMPSIRYAYNRWLRIHPNMAGKVTLKFAIDEFGNVLFCEAIGTNEDTKDLSEQVTAIVRKLNFGKIDKPGDITEAIYPLVFSM